MQICYSSDIMSELNSINKNIELEKKSVKDSETLEKMRLKFLGKKGEITLLMKDLGKMDQKKENLKQKSLIRLKIILMILLTKNLKSLKMN